MTTFKANRKFPNPITVTDDLRSHTLALQQIIEALNVGQRRTKEINSSYVRVSELVDMGLIEVIGNQLKLTNTGATYITNNTTATGQNVSIDNSWKFDTGTSAADPGTKKFSLNNATLASATAIYINDTSNENADASTVLGFIESGTRIYIQQKNDASRVAIFEATGVATDNTGWWTIPVSVISSGTLFQNTADCGLVFVFGGAGGGSGLTDLYDQTLSNLADVGVYLQSHGDILTYDSATGLWGAEPNWRDPGYYQVGYETEFMVGQIGLSGTAFAVFTQNGSTVTEGAAVENNHPGVLRVASNQSNAASGSAVWTLGGISVFSGMSVAGVVSTPADPEFLDLEFILRVNDVITVAQYNVGFVDFSGEANAHGVYLRGKASGFDFVTERVGTGANVINILSVAPADSAWFKLNFRVNSSIAYCYINDVLVATSTTYVPTTSARLRPAIFATNSSISINPPLQVDVDYMKMSQVLQTRRY